jgi:hypothetical protein
MVATQGTRRLVGFQGSLGPLQGEKVVVGKEMIIRGGMIRGGLSVMLSWKKGTMMMRIKRLPEGFRP